MSELVERESPMLWFIRLWGVLAMGMAIALSLRH
jgi:hypothetical protein